MESGPKIGIILSVADLYRQAAPDLPDRYAGLWRSRLEDLMGPDTRRFFSGVSCTAKEFSAAVKECEKAACDLLLVLPMAYAPSGVAKDALAATKIPLLIVSTARDSSLPYDMGADHMRANQAMHGVQDLANVLMREGRGFHLIAGHFSQAEFKDKFERVLSAADAARVLRRGRVGRLGDPFPGMLDFSFDTGTVSQKLGFESIKIEVEELVDLASKVSEDQIDAFKKWILEHFEVDLGISQEELNTSIRWSAALEQLADSKALDALTMNFIAVAEAGETLPFLGACRLMSRGIGYAGEGDVLTAALTTAMARMAGQATFSEMFCPDYERGEILLSHMGECNPALANPRTPRRLLAKPFDMADIVRPATPVFQLQPGPVTLVSLTEVPTGISEKSFRIIAAAAEVLQAPVHDQLTNPYTRLKISGDLSGFLERYSRAGGTHHLALAYGDRVPQLRTLSELTGLEFRQVET